METSKIEKIKLDPKVLTELGRKGNLLIYIQSALILADMNGYQQTHLIHLIRPKNLIHTKAWKGVVNGNGGAFWLLDEEGEIFNKMYDLAKKAKRSLNQLDYTQSVIDLVNSFYEIPNLRGRSGPQLDKNSLKGIQL